jgi:DNA-binding MarR family transcriptional regulator
MSSNPKGIAWDEQPLGEVPDHVIARRLGCSVQAVYGARKRRGIAALRGQRSDRILARAIVDALPTKRSDLIPIRHFALMLFIGTGEWSLREVRDGLGISQASASDVVRHAAEAGRVVIRRIPAAGRRPDEPTTYVSLSPKGHREMGRRRKKRVPGGRRD